MTTPHEQPTWRAKLAASAVVAATLLGAAFIAPAQAQEGPPGDAPGNKGTVKIHDATTPDDDRRDEPKVCEFRIVGFGFPDDADLEISIGGHGGPNAGDGTFSASVDSDDLSAEGDFAIAGPTLSDGMYKLFVENTTAPGGAKQKVFEVDCEDEVGGEDTSGGDDTDVLGNTVDRTPTDPAPSDTAVLGNTVTRTPVAARSSLPRTGIEWVFQVALAIALMGVGTLMVRSSKRTLASST